MILRMSSLLTWPSGAAASSFFVAAEPRTAASIGKYPSSRWGIRDSTAPPGDPDAGFTVRKICASAFAAVSGFFAAE
jgi:hypothetical protein